MKFILNNIKVPVSHTKDDIFSKANERLDELKIKATDIQLYRKSLDARRKNNLHYICAVLVTSPICEDDFDKIQSTDIKIYNELNLNLEAKKNPLQRRTVIVGTGPCGLFAGYILAKAGHQPILLERGADVDKRAEIVQNFWKYNTFDKNTNVQFGEGGAGTFSDGKLTTRIGDPLQRIVLGIFVKNGAPEDILYKAKPHIGTDRLKNVVKNIRKEIEDMGGTVKFNSTVTDIITKDDKICGVMVNNNEEISCDNLIMAIGHSSRDTYRMLYDKGVAIQSKAFAAGVRIEHSQDFINKTQYGEEWEKSGLPSADYRLTYNGKERSCYSFCMCPGGTVVNASSEEKALVINGMSEYSRNGKNANSALVVTVTPSDFENDSPLSGIEFQRKYESLAYSIGNGKAPTQLAYDFINNKVSTSFEEVLPSFTGTTVFADLRECLPEFIIATLKEGLLSFEQKIKGYVKTGAILTGVETRTSAPLRILRDENYESLTFKGLYPAGEGAGYAGGIMSAAVDGIKIALKISQI